MVYPVPLRIHVVLHPRGGDPCRPFAEKICSRANRAAALAASDGPGHVGRLAATRAGRYVCARSLGVMRTSIADAAQARVALGGKPHGFMGALAGTAEEAPRAAERQQLIHVPCGFGRTGRFTAKPL